MRRKKNMLKFLKSKKEFVLFLKGKSYKITNDHKNYKVIEELLALEGVSEEALLAVVDVAEVVKALSTKVGAFDVRGDEVFYNNQQVPSDCAEHIINLHDAGQLDDSFVKFIDLLMKNPNPEAVTDLYKFMLKGKMPITDDGRFCAYRVCTSDFKDKHSGKFDNSIGAIVKMDRGACNSNRNETCSTGLHFCSESYIGSFRGCNDRLLMVAISPEDVVAIPNDYNDAKGRCCKFEVIKEIELGSITGVGKVKVEKSKTANIVKENLSVADGMKQCSKCKHIKLLDEFSKDSKSKSGRRSSCKACDSKAKKPKDSITEKTSEKAVTKVEKQPLVESIAQKAIIDSTASEVPANSITKVCSKCKMNLPLENFGNDKTTKDGKYSSCKSCVKKSRSK